MTVQIPGPGPAGPLPHEYQHAEDELLRRQPRLRRRWLRKRNRAHRSKEKVARDARQVSTSRAEEAQRQERTEGALQRLRDRGRGTGPDHDVERGLSTAAYVLIMAVVAALQFVIDRGAMLTLLLPLGLTTAAAVFVTAVQLFAAHFAGHLLRREHHSVFPAVNIGRFEIGLGRACLVFGVAIAVVLAVIRAAGGGLLSAVLFALVGVLAFVVAVVASYAYAHDGVAAVDRTRRQQARARRLAAHDMRRLLKSLAAWRAACQAFCSQSTLLCAFVDHAFDAAADSYARNHPEESLPVRPELPWLNEARLASHGVLPGSLDVSNVLLEAGVDPAEVL